MQKKTRFEAYVEDYNDNGETAHILPRLAAEARARGEQMVYDEETKRYKTVGPDSVDFNPYDTDEYRAHFDANGSSVDNWDDWEAKGRE